MRRVLFIVSLTALSLGCGNRAKDPGPPAAAKEELVFLEMDKPFRIDLGRGSGWHGLETISILSDDEAELVRSNRGGVSPWKRAKIKLSKGTVTAIATALHARGVLWLDRSYTSPVADGEQWVIRAQQENREKAIYFSNNFPETITGFAEDLDRILDVDRLDPQPAWLPLFGRGHDKDLWESIHCN